MRWISYIPKSYLSWIIGQLANLPLPKFFANILVRWFANAYRVDYSLATRPIDSFCSIGAFFTRDLKPEIRPIGAGIVSPVDGTLRGATDISDLGEVTLIKGRALSVERMLGGGALAQRFSQGQLWNFYLSPQDAHHIFSPVDGSIIESVHIPGKLWPVNDWAIASIDGLFAINERVVTFIETAHGLVAVVMVGATNVGRISLSYTKLESNRAPWRHHFQKTIQHNPPISVGRGDKLGTFKMGSTVVLVFERRPFNLKRLGRDFTAEKKTETKTEMKVKFGEELSRLAQALSS